MEEVTRNMNILVIMGRLACNKMEYSNKAKLKLGKLWHQPGCHRRAPLRSNFFFDFDNRTFSEKGQHANGYNSDCHIVFCYVFFTQFFVEFIVKYFSGDAFFVEIIYFCDSSRSVVICETAGLLCSGGFIALKRSKSSGKCL